MTFHPRHARRSLARAGAPDGWAKAATRRAAIGCCRPARKMCAGSNFLTLPAPALQARRVEGAERARKLRWATTTTYSDGTTEVETSVSAQGSKAISLDRPTTRKDRSAPMPRAHPTALQRQRRRLAGLDRRSVCVLKCLLSSRLTPA